MSKYRDRYKKQRKNLQKRQKETNAEQGSGLFSGILDRKKMPEGIGFWKCPEGTRIIDIIPFNAGSNVPKAGTYHVEKGEFAYAIDVWTHQKVGVLNSTYVCQAYSNLEPCPICEYIKKNGDQLTKDEHYAMKAKRRTLYLIWCRDNNTEEEKGIQIWDVANWFIEDKLKYISQRSKGGGEIPFYDVDTGNHVVFTRTGSGPTNTGYTGHKLEEREDPVIPEEILDQTFSLDDALIYTSYEDIKKAFYAGMGNNIEPEQTEVQDGSEFYDNPNDEEQLGPDNDPDPVTETSATDECPVEGGTFGVDLDTLDLCLKDCPLWDNCMNENERLDQGGGESEEEKKEKEEEARKEARRKARKKKTTTGRRSK